jgi:hypothetical protein
MRRRIVKVAEADLSEHDGRREQRLNTVVGALDPPLGQKRADVGDCRPVGPQTKGLGDDRRDVRVGTSRPSSPRT